MKILLAISSVEFGGAEQYLAELADELYGRGHQVVLAAPDSVAARFERGGSRNRMTLVTGDLQWAWGPEDGTGSALYAEKVTRQRNAFAAILERLSVDFVLVNANWPTHYAGIMQALCAARVKFGAHFHLCPHTIPLNPLARRIHSEVLPHASFLTTVSNATRFFAEQTFGRMLGFEVIPNGSRFIVDSSEHEALSTTLRKNVLLSIGRLDYQKGYLDLVPAFNLPGGIAPYKLQLLGDGPLGETLRSLLSPSGGTVQFVGQVKNVEEYLRSADGFVLPSHFEGMSLAILEAMALGCIPIISNASSAGEIVTEGENGFLFEVGNWRSFLSALQRFHRADKVALRRACLTRSLRFSRSRMLGAMAEKFSLLGPETSAPGTNVRSIRSRSQSRTRPRPS